MKARCCFPAVRPRFETVDHGLVRRWKEGKNNKNSAVLELLLAWGTPNLAVSGEQKDSVYLFITVIITNTYWLCSLEEEKKDIAENILFSHQMRLKHTPASLKVLER